VRISIKRLAVVIGLSSLSFACSPMTDIVATNTEGTGDYAVKSTRVSDNMLSVDVCVANPDRAADVASRIVRQLLNHEYRMVTLNVASPAGPVGRFLWSETAERREPGGPPASICSDGRQSG
jgi:hypothetical protein